MDRSPYARRHAENVSTRQFTRVVPKHLAAKCPYMPREILRVNSSDFVQRLFLRMTRGGSIPRTSFNVRFSE